MIDDREEQDLWIKVNVLEEEFNYHESQGRAALAEIDRDMNTFFKWLFRIPRAYKCLRKSGFHFDEMNRLGDKIDTLFASRAEPKDDH